ncbi:MAG: hypothetical protein IPM61_16365 [Chlorobi bacterium]|nr:hypothetical protein [Chlorobiota bacterium]
MNLPNRYRQHYRRHAATIAERLQQFQQVPETEYLMELCFCLLTPQSKAEHAQKVMARLMELDFPKPSLTHANPSRPGHYIRFHNQKGSDCGGGRPPPADHRPAGKQ